MTESPRQWIRWALIGVAIGAALGVAIGWWLWPVTYTNAPLSALRQDYRDEVVLMIATAYELEGDGEWARERLAFLSPDDPAAPVVELAERRIEEGGSEEEIRRLARLASAVDAPAPSLTPHLRS